MDIWDLYRQMLRCRLFEQAVADLWRAGEISGEMHTGIGEEAIVAGVLAHLQEGDALALDHRGTAPLIVRGVSLALLLDEFLGRESGLCGGLGGHMHLFSPEHLAASSGIVGASGPAGVGFALAAQMLRPGSLSVAFFGEGAMNQGMLMEALHLASVWHLPVLFVCKDDGWAITTRSPSVTRGDLVSRARSFGLETRSVDGTDVKAVWQATRDQIAHIRKTGSPAFLHARCVHYEAHMLGLQLARLARHPIVEIGNVVGAILRALISTRGAHMKERLRGLIFVLQTIWEMRSSLADTSRDPLRKTRLQLTAQPERLNELEQEARDEIEGILSLAQSGAPSRVREKAA